MNTLGCLDLLLFGPSWNNRAVFLIPYDILLTPPNMPEMGLVTNPAIPVNAPVIPAPMPSFLYP